DRRLGPAARAVIAGGEVYFSAASAWEIAIKAGLGKLHLPATYDIGAELELDGFHPLPIDLVHARAAGVLPLIHRDPFDRMLIAQARCEGLVLATGNSEMSRYDVPVLAVDG
ncbi:MAG TPA: type II toxin-antitoxin system VapC family toxin, partial [Gemmatimonadaceae bacterium]|nr:type II toxin-antitoxin system VapC family toxin [Gemmatimonadaceae bacterium]